MASDANTMNFQPLTPKMALQLAAPHTWPAAILPTLIATCAAASIKHVCSVSASIVCLVIVILMQSAVNTFNDYYDYVKGADSESDNVDPSDAVLVYNNINPRDALFLAIGMLISAFVLGLYIIFRAGITPFIIALIGTLFVVIYSAGKTPVSYLPIGEIISGVVMGGLIPLATYLAITLELNSIVLIWSIPTIIGIGLIMLTNNTCDIERDIPANRKTLSVLIGRGNAVRLYHIALALMIISILANTAVFFTQGLIVSPFMLLAAYPSTKALLTNPLTQDTRQQAMSQILGINVTYCAFYAASIALNGIWVSTIL